MLKFRGVAKNQLLKIVNYIVKISAESIELILQLS